MKIAIVNNSVPFLYGGAEFLADSLSNKLREYGHETEKILFPFAWSTHEKIVDSIMTVRMSKLDNTDLVIGLKFPAYYIQHSNKKLWLLHQFRQAYDLYGTEYTMLQENNPNDVLLKNTITELDNQVLGELEGKIYTNSQVVSNRLKKFNHIDSKVLYPPLMDDSLYHGSREYGDYIFYPSRVNHSKRQHLAVEAMRYTTTGVRLVIAGKGDTPEDEKYLLSLIEKYELKDKVTYLNRFISEQEKVDLFSKALCGIYIPYDEDSYGYVTLEGFHSGKAVISCFDCGGTDVLIKEGITGYVSESQPQQIAESMDKMFQNKRKTMEMGNNGIPMLESLGITWDNVIRRLTE